MLGGVYGCLDVETEDQPPGHIHRSLGVLTPESPEYAARAWPRVGLDLDKRVWGARWANWLGAEHFRQLGGLRELSPGSRGLLSPEQIEQAYQRGIEHLRACDCYHEWLELAGGALLTLSPSPLEPSTALVQERRARLQEALGQVALGPWDMPPGLSPAELQQWQERYYAERYGREAPEKQPPQQRPPSSAESYTFRALQDGNLGAWTGPLLRMPQSGDFYLHAAAFRGAALRLFGAPLGTSENAEAAFDYVVEACDSRGNSWILTVYQGPTGPAIGGNRSDPSACPPAEALLHLLETTTPADFEAVMHYADADFTVVYGCKDGQCYMREASEEQLGLEEGFC
jgi:hypothetical protein